MNDEQKNLLIRQAVAIVLGPLLTGFGVTATQVPMWVNVVATIVGGLLTLGGMAYSQYKTRNAGLVASAGTVSKEALNADPKLAAAVATTAAKVEGTVVITKPEVAQVAPSVNVVSSATNQVVRQ